MKTTTSLFVAIAMALAFGMTTIVVAQETRGPGSKTAHATLFTSPVNADVFYCTVLNTSTQALEVDIRVVYHNGPTLDDTSAASTQIIGPKKTGSISATAGGSPTALMYCRFTFAGAKSQVRAMMVATKGTGSISSEAR